jgi:hypothetical protein
MSYAYRCEVCAAMPLWRIERRGDATVSWACMNSGHLVTVMDRLLQPWRNRTELIVTMPAKIP